MDVRVEVGKQLLLTFASPRVTFRFMGGGPAGLVADTKFASPEKYQVAAVLAYQRLSGVGPPRAEREVPTSTPHQLSGSRERLRAAVSQLLTDTVRLGLAHLSASVHQRYETLAVWAQGAEYHRLARALRRLADHVGSCSTAPPEPTNTGCSTRPLSPTPSFARSTKQSNHD